MQYRFAPLPNVLFATICAFAQTTPLPVSTTTTEFIELDIISLISGSIVLIGFCKLFI